MLFLTPHSIISVLLATALLFTSPAFANPIDSTDVTLEERAPSSSPDVALEEREDTTYKAVTNDSPETKSSSSSFGAHTECWITTANHKTFKYKIIVQDTKHDRYSVYGGCRFYSKGYWMDSPKCWNRKGYPKTVECKGKVNQKINGVKATACVNNPGKDRCRSGDQTSF